MRPICPATCASKPGPPRTKSCSVDRHGSAAGALAIRSGARRRVFLRREEPLGGELADLARFRPPVDQHLPRSAAARQRKRSRGALRQRESGTGGGLSSFRTAALEPATPPDLYVIGPGDFRHPLDLVRLSPGTYRGRLRIGSLEGLFRVRPLNESRSFPEVGLVSPGIRALRLRIERSAAEVDRAIDRRPLQSVGCGSCSIPAESTSTPRCASGPALLALAVLLNLIELVMRKWRGIIESIRGVREPGPRPAAA